MNMKRTFGGLLTILGIIGLIYAGYLGLMTNGGYSVQVLAVTGILGAIFFFTGVSLIRNTQDTAR
jgi:uncharacterized membrane protein